MPVWPKGRRSTDRVDDLGRIGAAWKFVAERRTNRYEISIFLVRASASIQRGDGRRLTLPSLSFGDRACDFIIDGITGKANKSLMALQGLLVVQRRNLLFSFFHQFAAGKYSIVYKSITLLENKIYI